MNEAEVVEAAELPEEFGAVEELLMFEELGAVQMVGVCLPPVVSLSPLCS